MNRYRILKIISAVIFLTLFVTSCGRVYLGTGDSTGPTVVSIHPENGLTNVALDTLITATFSEHVESASLTPATFYLDEGVTGSVSYNSAEWKAIFTPDSDLKSNTTYMVTLTNGVYDWWGNRLALTTWSFTTGNQEG